MAKNTSLTISVMALILITAIFILTEESAGNTETVNETVFTVGEFEYTVISTEPKEVMVSDFFEYTLHSVNIEDTVTKPDTGDVYDITEIGDSAFFKKSVKTVTIGDNVKIINYKAFSGCDKLTTVIFGSGVKTIVEYAFFDCPLLGTLTIPDNVETIGNRAFGACSYLKTVSIGTGIKTIGIFAFNECKSLNSVEILGSGTTFIGQSAFNGIHSLKTVTLGDGVKTIGEFAFYDCTSLSSIEIPGSVDTISNGTFEGCTALKTVTLGDGVKKIGTYAFDTCKLLNTLIMYESVEIIDDSAFSGCTALRTMTLGSGVKTIGPFAFNGCKSLASIEIPNSVTSIGNAAFGNCISVKTITIGNSVTEIGSLAFDGCTAVTSLTIGKGVTTLDNIPIGDMTLLETLVVDENNDYFKTVDNVLYDKGLTTLILSPKGIKGECTIPDDVKTIKDHAFEGRISLEKVTLGGRVTSIGDSAFKGCISLSSVKISNSVTSIGSLAFDGCTAVTSLTIGKGVKSLVNIPISSMTLLETLVVDENNDYFKTVDNVLYDKELTTLIFCPKGIKGECTIPDSIETIDSQMFENCAFLEKVTIGSGIKTIGDNAFKGCVSLLEVVILSDLSPTENSLGNDIFSGCTLLTKLCIDTPCLNTEFVKQISTLTTVEFGQNVVTIPEKMFENYTKLNGQIIIPDSVITIGKSAFAGCLNIILISLGKSITDIGDNAFAGCSSLSAVIVKSNLSSAENSFGDNVFSGCTSLTRLFVDAPCLNTEFVKQISTLTTVEFGQNVVTIPEKMFENNIKLSGQIIIPNSVTTIGSAAFSGCSNITSISLGDGITSIGDNAFFGCTSLEILKIGKCNIAACDFSFAEGLFEQISIAVGATGNGLENLLSNYEFHDFDDNILKWPDIAGKDYVIGVDGIMHQINEPTPEPASGESNIGLIVGIVVAAIAIVGIGVYFFIRFRKKKTL